jgi:hypothetical protein
MEKGEMKSGIVRGMKAVATGRRAEQWGKKLVDRCGIGETEQDN